MTNHQVLNNYIDFIEESLEVIELNDTHTEIVTPFVDSRGEGISFSVYYKKDRYVVSDDGFTLWEMRISGIDLEKRNRRKEILSALLHYHHFSLATDHSIYREVREKDLGQTINDMIQLLINIYDLNYLKQTNTSNYFYQEVRNYFEGNNDYIMFRDFYITGKSQLHHRFDYVFLYQNNQHKFAKVYNTLSHQQLDSVLVTWMDTSSNRSMESLNNSYLYLILSDMGMKDLKEEYQVALEEYNVKTLNFSKKGQLFEELGVVR